jgi:hypothetical protein
MCHFFLKPHNSTIRALCKCFTILLNKKDFVFFLILFSLCSISNAKEIQPCPEKILICGVCKDISPTLINTIKNIEYLGDLFADYAVIIYENNSSDRTPIQLANWAKINKRVIFKSENLAAAEMPASRTEKIARARNMVLEIAKDPIFQDFKYLVMADLDFKKSWPIEEILKTINSESEWDCVSANGVRRNNYYHDFYALRNNKFPFGPELLGDDFWWEEVNEGYKIPYHEIWMPVYSAFGGLAIYKTSSIINFSYSGVVTEDLTTYYKHIISSIPQTHPIIQKYLNLIDGSVDEDSLNSMIPIIFRPNIPCEHPLDYAPITCCEHVPLHASMFLHGFGKFYINPKMIMQYQ